MPQDKDIIEAKLHLSIEDKRLVLRYFPSANIQVASVEAVEGEKDHFLLLKLISGHLERPDSLVTAPVTLPSPVVTGTTPVVAGSSPEKHIHEGESRKINLDVKFTVQSLEQLHKQLMSSAKSENPQLLASNQSSDSSSEPTTSSQQQGSGPLNAEASRLSKVSSDSSHSEAQQKSSGDLLGPTNSLLQQGSGPPNVEASRPSKVSSDSTHSEAKQKSSGDLLEPTSSLQRQSSNVEASCQSKVSSDSIHSEAQQKSSGDLLAPAPLFQRQRSGPQNVEASRPSKVSSDSTHTEAQQKSSSDLQGQVTVSEQGGEADKASRMANHAPKRYEMELNKKKHTVHCFLHRSGMKCNSCPTPELCQQLYDEEFASEFEEYLNGDVNTSLTSANNEDSPRDNFVDHIVTHFLADSCPSFCSRLWKCCLDKKLFWIISKYAPVGLLIHSDDRPNAVGTVVKTYLDYRNVNSIGSGGFGNVYKYSDRIAVKEEFKPLIAAAGYDNPELFHQIMKLNHPHVIKVTEYIAGPDDKDGNKCFLSVMSYKNQRDICKQFTKLTCVAEYMKEYPYQEKFIFRNYTVLCQHVFKGLCYLKSEGIIHRDIKSSNILVHQECKCTSPIRCICADDGHVTYLLGDMDLLNLEKEDTYENKNPPYTCEEWEKMAGHDPAGTMGMKPPELFFRTAKGKGMTTHKSDVWSACVALMNVLLSKAVNAEVQKRFKNFIAAATEGAKAATKSVIDSSRLLISIMAMFDSVLDQMKKEPRNSGLVNNEMDELNKKLNALKKMLESGGDSLKRSQSFQDGYCDIYKEESPLAGILTTVHGARTLHWRCISRLPHIFNTQLWSVMEKTLDTINDGIKLMPDQRKDATAILNQLKAIPPVDLRN